jgi:hypothetical protein
MGAAQSPLRLGGRLLTGDQEQLLCLLRRLATEVRAGDMGGVDRAGGVDRVGRVGALKVV